MPPLDASPRHVQTWLKVWYRNVLPQDLWWNKEGPGKAIYDKINFSANGYPEKEEEEKQVEEDDEEAEEVTRPEPRWEKLYPPIGNIILEGRDLRRFTQHGMESYLRREGFNEFDARGIAIDNETAKWIEVSSSAITLRHDADSSQTEKGNRNEGVGTKDRRGRRRGTTTGDVLHQIQSM
jgi:hypothetical protein